MVEDSSIEPSSIGVSSHQGCGAIDMASNSIRRSVAACSHKNPFARIVDDDDPVTLRRRV